MSTPIPEDVMQASRGYAKRLMEPHATTQLNAERLFVAAIMAEREACAKIADSWGETAVKLGQTEAGTMASDIASAIRDRSKT